MISPTKGRELAEAIDKLLSSRDRPPSDFFGEELRTASWTSHGALLSAYDEGVADTCKAVDQLLDKYPSIKNPVVNPPDIEALAKFVAELKELVSD